MKTELAIFQHSIRDYLVEHQERSGFSTPPLLLEYLSDLLARRARMVDIMPEPSFAERYLELYTRPSYGDLKDYGDQCLFFCSLMPEYGARRGLGLDYYGSLGISAYYTLADLSGDSRFTQLGNWFYHLQRFLDSALHSHRDLELFASSFR
jgi:hypothetical protein